MFFRSTFDFELIVDGNEAYVDDAKDKFKMYKKSFRAIMVHYSLKREAEVVLGKPLHWNPLLKADKGSVSTAISNSYEALVQKYREEFFRDVVNQEEVRKKASAWYRVAYDKRLSQMVSNVIMFAYLRGHHDFDSTLQYLINREPGQLSLVSLLMSTTVRIFPLVTKEKSW